MTATTSGASAFGGTLLRWLSESRSGKASALRDGIRSQALAWGMELNPYADWDWMRKATALGFIDVDLRADRWSAAPPVLTRLPHADGLALLTGARTARISARVQEAATEWMELITVPHRTEPGEAPLPDTLLLQYEDPRTLPETAEFLGARYVPCAALQFVQVLPQAVPGPESAPPGGGGATTLEKYELRLQRFVPVAKDDEDGLYRWRGADYARLTRVRRDGVFYTVDRETGVYLELARHRTGVMRWRPEEARDEPASAGCSSTGTRPCRPCTSAQPFSAAASRRSWASTPRPVPTTTCRGRSRKRSRPRCSRTWRPWRDR